MYCFIRCFIYGRILNLRILSCNYLFLLVMQDLGMKVSWSFILSTSPTPFVSSYLRTVIPQICITYSFPHDCHLAQSSNPHINTLVIGYAYAYSYQMVYPFVLPSYPVIHSSFLVYRISHPLLKYTFLHCVLRIFKEGSEIFLLQ